MQNLIHKSTRSGYPADFLLPRIRRRLSTSHVEQNKASFERGAYFADDSSIWSEAVDERYRLHQLMEIDLRKTLAPVFVYFELNTLIICLRSLEEKQAGSLTINLEKSLLAKDLKKILLAKLSLWEIIYKLEKFFESSALKVKGLAEVYEEKGLKACEEMIRYTFLEQVIKICTHKEVTHFFQSLIDLKNIMTTAKCLRWGKDENPAVLNNGNIRMLKADAIPSEASLKKKMGRFAGGFKLTGEDLRPISLEPLLRSSFTRKLTRRMRGNDPVCMCIGYLWKSAETAREKSGEYHEALFVENFPDVPKSTS